MRRGALSICLLLARHPPGYVSPVMSEVRRLLAAAGTEVCCLCPDEELTDLVEATHPHDLYVLKSGTEAALSVAGTLHEAGAAVLNPYPVAAACRDKIVATRVLARAGVPVPESWCTGTPSLLGPLLRAGPLVVKPYRGHQGRGVRVVHDAGELDRMNGGEPIFAQRYHEPEGLDRKIYRIGDELYGVLRPWPARTYEQKLGEPFPVTGELRAIALQCGVALGVDLYGIDVVVSNGRPYVVDCSSFPGFKGVPAAASRLSGYIRAAAARVRRGEPMLAGAQR
jgi:ribosomal protein S6--L-glutamate ligase